MISNKQDVIAGHLTLLVSKQCCVAELLQVYDDQDQVSSAMSDIDPFWNMRGSTDRDRLDPFKDKDQFWRK